MQKRGVERFLMEAKTLFLNIRLQRGALRGVIEERRRNFSSCVGMGSNNLGFFLEEVERSFQRIEEIQWH